MSLLIAASLALKENNIEHENLVLNTNGSYNHGIHDGENVYCKVAPINGSNNNLTSLEKELEFAKTYSNQMPMLKPLYFQVIEFEHESVLRRMTVWQWEQIHVFNPNSVSPVYVSRAMDDLALMHQLPITSSLPVLSVDSLLESVAHRIQVSAQYSPSQTHMAILGKLVDRFYDSRDIDFSSPVLIHGDCHIGNYVQAYFESKWIDYESVRVAPKEWDYAGMYINLAITADNKEAWVQGTKSIPEYDADKFFQACAIKCISTASSILLRPQSYSIFEQRMESLESLLSHKQIPKMVSL